MAADIRRARIRRAAGTVLLHGRTARRAIRAAVERRGPASRTDARHGSRSSRAPLDGPRAARRGVQAHSGMVSARPEPDEPCSWAPVRASGAVRAPNGAAGTSRATSATAVPSSGRRGADGWISHHFARDPASDLGRTCES